VDNPGTILRTLDGHLDHEVMLVLYGRAAIHLGFEQPPAAAGGSMDVDAIIPMDQLDALSADEGFWEAQEKTNQELSSLGLYITHLFREQEVFLRRSWREHVVPITKLRLPFLRLFRPATIDLILTKMMRGADAQDLSDIAFMIGHDHVFRTQLEQAFAEVRLPDIVELHDAFEKARPAVLALAKL
jgi:hypothetical protein